MTAQRRLAAILVADVVGFSRLVGADETGTLARLATLRREVVDPEIARHAGRLFKETGDGFLVEFGGVAPRGGRRHGDEGYCAGGGNQVRQTNRK